MESIAVPVDDDDVTVDTTLNEDPRQSQLDTSTATSTTNPINHDTTSIDTTHVITTDPGPMKSSAPTSSSLHTTSSQPPPPPPSTIQMISPESIQRIVSGQAIYDLASCIKELIDNSIDANSTTINIRLYNKGIDIIEVSDDGIGIEKESYPYIALPHATSKIIHFSDIYHNNSNTSQSIPNRKHTTESSHENPTTTQPPHSTASVEESSPSRSLSSSRCTFGFRGEALHCIANISEKLMIATRTSSDTVATKMEFHVDGTMNPATVTTIPRKIGTTVAVLKLFYNLPVRYKDYTLHIKEQRTKLVQLIIGYAVFLSPTIRFHIMDINSKNGKEKSLFITPYYPPSSNHRITLKDSVSSILGCNILHHLTDITIDLSPYVQQAETINSNYNDSTTGNTEIGGPINSWIVKGLISTGLVTLPKSSSSTHPTTSTTTTSQHKPVHYFAINQRPVDLPVVSRLINKVYKSMWRTNSSTSFSTTNGASCTCILEFTLPLHVYDINLSPDKRKVQFWNADLLYSLLECALIDFWTPSSYTKKMGDNYSIVDSITMEGQQAQLQRPKPQRRNTSFSCGKASLVTAESQTSSSNPKNNTNMTNKNQDLDDDDSMDAFDNIDSPPSARRISSTRTKDDVSLLNSSFHSAYSNDSFTSTTNRSYHRRYAFVHDPQQSIQKQQEYGYDQYMESLSVSQQPQNVSTNDYHELHSMNSNIEGDMDRKPKSSNTSLRIDLDQVGLSVSNSDRLSALQTVTPSPCLIIAEKMIDTESSSSLWSNNINHATIPASKPSVSLKEHKQFQQVQQRFRRSDSQDSTSLLQMPTSSASDNNSKAVGQNHNRSVMPPRKSSSLLDRFGYKKKATDTSTEESTAVAPTSNTIDRSLSNELIVQPELKRPRTTVVDGQHHSVAKNPNARLGKHPIAEKQQVFDASSSVPVHNNESEVPATEAVLWPGMNSEDVVMASMRDRIATIQRKRQRNDLDTISKRDFASINDDDPESAPAAAATSPQSQNDDGTNHDSRHSLTKDDLKNMKVIGQFNLGFIVVMSPDNCLWILDQHACDERYQFETLQRQTTKFFEQPLIAPLPLELSYLEEACIVDNTKIFEQNGFRLQYDETKPSRHRFSLLAVPHSGAPDGRNAVQYGKQDVQDICAILLGRNHHNYMDGEDDTEDMYSYNVHGGTGTDGTGLYGNNAVRRYASSGGMSLTQQSTRDDNAADGTTGEWTEQSSAEQIIARLPKTIAMFASRACRNSIMIGKALSTKEMEKIIQHLSVVDTPWMCAHGRPTICHVQQPHWNVSNMVQMDDRCASEHIAGPTITCLSQQEDYEQE